jgi:preprotein translocase subunit SecE
LARSERAHGESGDTRAGIAAAKQAAIQRASGLRRVCAALWDHELKVKNPFQFIDEVRQETSKVTWPSWKEVWITTAMVLVMVALTSVFFLFADMIISWVIQFVLQLGR